MPRIVQVFDTTLRDGEQSPGASLNVKEKVEIARQLARLNVDVIEAGFPIASPGDFEAVKAIAEEVTGPTIAALARATKTDIDRAWEALRHARRPRIHTFIATSDIHMKYKLRKEPAQVLEMAVAAVKLAKSYVEDVEFSAEDATRSNPEFLKTVFEEVIKAGATVLNVPDTVGYATPQEFARLICYLKENVKGIDKVILSVHCHNDLGLAVANSLVAIENGAQQVECTVNGIGERAGNAALEEIVMALATRRDYYDAVTRVVTEQIYRTSRMVSTFTGIAVQVNKAIVGDNAFAHEAGIHQDGILKERTTYEIMTPESIGLTRSRLVLGKHSGRHAFAERLKELGYVLTNEEINRAYEEFIALADKKKEVSDRDIEAIVEGRHAVSQDRLSLDYLTVVSGNKTVPTATVRLYRDGQLVEEAACGDGPVDATYKAIDRITGERTQLVDYSIRAATSGKDALGEVVVKIRDNGNLFTGRGVSTDIIEASAIAYINAINKMLLNREYGQKAEPAPAEPASLGQ
ncbi:MAG TPA: 2-isopropylmalate synthase [Firmicutes bacterium]|nr:2-isopropylmalate synthase [Bacillota bacterium]